MTFIRHLAIRSFFSDCIIGEPLIFLTHSKSHMFRQRICLSAVTRCF